MKTNRFLLLVSSLFIIGCAHKSGHNKQGFSQEERGVISQQSTMQKSGTKVTDDNQGRVKMDGSEIFSKYNTAVFMVFTSDGYNMYQGSGFFIDNSGLAVSNYHVFQNTSIGEEGIKLTGSNDIYKVSEILQRSEKEDFILFRPQIRN